VLELGCGSGRVLLPIARAGGAITGVDSSHAMLERCRAGLSAEPAELRSRVVLHEGAAVRAFDGAEILNQPRVTPYDAFAVWLHLKRARFV